VLFIFTALWRDELKQPALRIPIQRHLGLPTTHRVQIQMAWLTAFKDRPDDVRVLAPVEF
jgi:hypothetical protein